MNHRISVVITATNLDYGDAKVQEDILDLIREFQVNLVELWYFGVIAWLFWTGSGRVRITKTSVILFGFS